LTIGPIDLQIDRGEIIFIVGENGCGKSTFLKMLTGLYFSASWGISVDGAELTALDDGSYRDLFSAIFITSSIVRMGWRQLKKDESGSFSTWWDWKRRQGWPMVGLRPRSSQRARRSGRHGRRGFA
jgi:ABC-type siderophore export system fused ATPase/permease subunit